MMETLSYNTKRINGWLLRAAPEFSDEEAFQLCCRIPDAADGRFTKVKSSATTVVFRFSFKGRDYYLKHYLFENWRKHMRLCLKVFRLPKTIALLRKAGFHAPEIVCLAVRGRQMFSVSVAAEANDRVLEIYQFNSEGFVSDMSRFRMRFGEEIGRLHSAGFVHGDLRWGNVLVRNSDSDNPEFFYLDNDRTRKWSRIPVRGRIKNLVQIHFPELVCNHPAANWEEFWEGYCKTCPAVQADEVRWRKQIEKITLKRVEKWLKKPGHNCL